MTKTVQITDLREVKALTLTCVKCGASFSMPIGKHNTPENCHNCGMELDKAGIDELVSILRRLNHGDAPAWRLTFETDPDR